MNELPNADGGSGVGGRRVATDGPVLPAHFLRGEQKKERDGRVLGRRPFPEAGTSGGHPGMRSGLLLAHLSAPYVCVGAVWRGSRVAPVYTLPQDSQVRGA